MEFGASDAIDLVKCVGNWTWEQARFSMCFNSLVEEFDQEKKKLEANMDDMHKNVKNSVRNTIEVASRDKLDLKNAEDLRKEVDKLQEEVNLKKACCHGRCPDLYWQDRIGRQLADKTEDMKKLNAQFQPQKFSRIQSLPGMEYYSSKDFIPLRSTKKAFDELLMALNDPNIRRIGLHGMGGCGKTTLVKEVGKEAQKLFEKVVFVTVSRNLEVRKIQGSIADHLNLTLKEENEQVRAKRLYLRLCGSEKILIILDDVWEELNFEAIGIPFHEKSEGCRILLTTRLRGVCVSLKCKEVSLGLLSEEEAWQLFQKHAGINENASEKFLKGLPRDINKACKGLPIAITAFAKALKDKDLDDWKDVYDLLKHCQQVDIQNKSEDPYGSLEFSYNCLKDKEAEELFLLCSLFPEDSEIKKEDLIRMAIGLGLFGNVNSCNNARRKGRWAIGKLLDSFLLLKAKDGMSVMLHDILRAVALRIAVNKIQTILEPTGRHSLMKLPEHVAPEEITKLYCYNINEFPLQFECPNLEILIVCKDAKGSPKLPNEFFKEMRGLKVLTIMDKSSWQKSTLMLPESIWSLKLLRTLCIRGCRLDSNFSLEQLKHLEILEFCNCSIMQLPNDIAELEKLKLLDVSRCRVRGNPYKVLGHCEELEELHFSEIELDREELKDQNLAEFFEKNDLSKLERYNVQIGARVEKLKDDPKSRFLSISPYSDQDKSTSTTTIKALAQNAEVLFLENIPKSVENVIPDIVFQEGVCLKDLIELLICNSEGIKYLIDTTQQLNQNTTVLSNLLKLRITGMKCMEGFCKGEPTCGLFEQLKELECSQLPVLSSLGNPKLCNLVILKLDSCPKLESLFTPAVAVSLSLLEELKVTKCHGLIYIIGDDKEEDITDGNDQRTYKSVFKKLKELVVGDCSKLEYLIPLSFAWGLENLEILKIYLAPNLKYGFGKYSRPQQSSYQNQNVTHIIDLPVLKVLELLNLEEIISICSKNYNVKFPHLLESHIVDKCPNLYPIISTNAPMVDSDIEVQVQLEGEPPRKAKLSFMPSGTSIVAKNIKEWVFAPILRQARYSLSFNTYVKDLQSETEILKFTTASLRDRAEGETLELDSRVQEWLVNAGTLIKEAEKLEQKAIEYRSCCFGHFPNWIQQYRIGKQAERKINAIVKHNQSREFQKFSQRASLPCMDDYFKENFILFNSRKTIYYSVLELLKENEISIIGLHGTGGCGKTTLAKLMAKEAEQLFDKVIFVDVSSNRDVRKIQEKIARTLNWKLLEASESVRAKNLFMRLSTGERVLIILDNARDRLNLEDIGIPYGVNHKGCSILIITRSKQVCIMMDCRRMFSLLPLSEEEAWFLLQRHARIREDTNDSLKDVSKEVARECGGLPIAIVALASTLKGKTEDDWKEALTMLRSPTDNEADLGSTYKCLQVSYHNLADENAKSLFLLCSIFPEDFEIYEEHLMRYGIVLGLFGEVSSYERGRDKVREAKEKLIDSCLLFKEDKGQWVKMHSLFRDIALSIANKEIVTLEGTHEWQLGNTIRYLWCENVGKLPNQFYFPKLEFLHLGVLNNLMLPDEFFNGMKCLRVLVLRCNSYFPKQNSYFSKQNLKIILSLPNLVGLFLEGWELGDISFMVRLNKLEALVLRRCSFQEIPSEITELRKLRLLELSNCRIERNSYEAIGRCSQLQELYFIGNSCSKWNYQRENGVAFFQEKEIALRLERYCVEIGRTFGVLYKGDFSTSRSLYIEYFDASSSNATIKNLVQRAEVLSLGKISGGCENIIPDMVQKIGEGMNGLIELQLKNSDEIKCITGSIGHVGAFFPCLTKLDVNSLKHMEALCIGPIPAGSFQKLKKLQLYNCPLLESLFTVAVAQSLEMLEIMSITKCDRLKHVIWDADADTEAKQEIITIDDDDQKSISAFPKLEVLRVQYCRNIEYLGGHWLLNFGSLKVLNVGYCSSLKSLLTASTAKTMTTLEELDIKCCSSLTEVFGAPYGEGGQALTLTRLKMLRITKLPNLIEVSRGFKLQHVINVEVDNCPKFHGPVVGFQNLSQGQNPGERKIRIRGLHGMESLCCGPTPANSFEKLKELELCECPSLKSLLTVAVTQSLEMLQILRIIKCERFEHLICDVDANADRDAEKEIITIDNDQKSTSAFSKLEVLNISYCKNLEYLGGHWLLNLSSLKVLKVISCSSLKSMFTPSTAKTMTSLEELSILECPSLKEVFGVPNDEDGQALILPRLKMFRFTKLPNLIEVSRGFKLQHVINAEVYDCPLFGVRFDGFRDMSQAQNADEIKYIADSTIQVGAFFPA
ncbi:hypothetical protein L6164_031694 [Bauhinia variegata]|uniref:Uncharacterized protein n=1 Tax=Bauhinia variegata TaxID=167791 RepID=A0ACB9LHY0_BAUVA|nr:hypothetical protein L6164_031694 [Bauhinia variegata]